jgi:multidrug efflux system outer membrane protein
MSKQVVVIAAATLLAGCSFMPDFLRPVPPVSATWPASANPQGAHQASATSWHVVFPDQRLQVLIRAALEHNADIRLAYARIEEARAIAGIARADRFPTLNATAGRTASHTPGDLTATGRPLTSQRYDVSLAVPAFELDFWGRVASLDAAAQASFLATEQARRSVHLSLVADVAGAYFTALELAERTELARATVASREESRRLIAKRRDVGIASDLDYLQADGAWLSARTELANLERQWAAAENALGLLVGRLPEDLPAGKSLAEQGVMGDFAANLPAEVLLERPDILAAEQKLIAAHANIGAARAAFLPKIVLTAAYGTASKALGGLFNAGSAAWSFQPLLTQPLFDWGRIESSVDLAEARKEIAVVEYEKTIQTAFREVADLLAARSRLAEQLEAQIANEATQRQRVKLAQARYDAGIASHLEVLDAERDAFSAQQATTQLRRTSLAASAQLYKALGGGE